QTRLSRGGKDRRRSRNAERDPRFSAAISLHYQYNAGVGKRPIEALLLSIFLIGGSCAGFRGGNENAGDKFARLDNGFIDEALLGRYVEVAHGYGTFASLRGKLYLGIHCEQRYSRGRGMHHRAGAVVHNGVILILPRVRVTIVTGPVLFLTVKVGRPEVPASRALHDISSQRRHIAHLWSCRVPGRIR